RVPVGRARDGPGPQDARPSDRRGRHDPHRRGDGGRETAARRGQPSKAAGVRMNHTEARESARVKVPGLTSWYSGERPANTAVMRGRGLDKRRTIKVARPP